MSGKRAREVRRTSGSAAARLIRRWRELGIPIPESLWRTWPALRPATTRTNEGPTDAL